MGTFYPDGSYTGANVNPSHSAHVGVWLRTGDRKFAFTVNVLHARCEDLWQRNGASRHGHGGEGVAGHGRNHGNQRPDECRIPEVRRAGVAQEVGWAGSSRTCLLTPRPEATYVLNQTAPQGPLLSRARKQAVFTNPEIALISK